VSSVVLKTFEADDQQQPRFGDPRCSLPVVTEVSALTSCPQAVVGSDAIDADPAEHAARTAPLTAEAHRLCAVLDVA
jgi:hypothetical protein